MKKYFNFYKKHTQTTGFTMFEFLVVIAIVVLLTSIVLMSLNSAKIHTRDQARITDIRRVETALANYYSVCREYPLELTSLATCDNLSATTQGTLSSKTLADFITDIDSFQFGKSGSRYRYAALTHDASLTGSSVAAASNCSPQRYHIGVELEETNSALANNDSQYNSRTTPTSSGLFQCVHNTGFDGANTSPRLYDRVNNY